ncbi:MAG: arginase family protein [Candidatus Thorarchaeota archaeon]|nr:arginase family protein [Candidatus Thorarchaeota archaeon]
MVLREELRGYLKGPDAFFGIPAPESGEPDVGVLGVPYDLTSSYYPGCRFGPAAVRRATTRERSHSQPLSVDVTPDREMVLLSESMTLEDIGDLELEGRVPEMAMYDISDAATKLASRSSRLLFIGGDHFVTYPLVKGLKRGTRLNLGLIWLDAHADYYGDYGGLALSHATTLRRIVDGGFVDAGRVVAFDMRAALSEHRRELIQAGASVCFDHESFSSAIRELADRVDTVYMTVDLDVLRPDQVPGVSHPESGGPDVTGLVRLIRDCFASCSLRFADLVELNPLLDSTGIASVAARDIVKEILVGFSTQD